MNTTNDAAGAAARPVDGPAPAVAPPDVLVLDRRTGCWRSWCQAPVATLSREQADDGEWISGQVHVGDESFTDDGTLEVRRGTETVAAWLAQLGNAPVGSKHSHADAVRCKVCHDHYEYVVPDTLPRLWHRAHQVAAAYERLAGVDPGSAIRVRVASDDGVLVASLELADGVRVGRLVGFEWRSDSGWAATTATDAPGTVAREDRYVLLGAKTWMPRRVALEIDDVIAYYR